jgi:hypothetical protein
MALALIASIYFAPVKAERNYGGPYEMPAVPPGAEPALLPVQDRVQIEEGPYQLGHGGRRAKNRHLVSGESIARDLVNEWTGNGLGMTPQCRPGIWVVRDRIPLLQDNGMPALDADGLGTWRPASEEERAAMWLEDLTAARAADHAYANMLFLQANAKAEDPRLIPYIPANAKLAARQYGMTAEWLKENAALNVRPCPFCTKIISSAAIKCPQCSEIVNVDAYVALEAQRAAAIKAATKELTKDASRSAA